MAADRNDTNLAVLPIEQVAMPAEDVSDLREVVDAINKLCATMKSSYEYDDSSDVVIQEVESGLVSPTEVVVRTVQTDVAERWSEPLEEVIPQTENLLAPSEPATEMYYSATADATEEEVSLPEKWSNSVAEVEPDKVAEVDPVSAAQAFIESTSETYYTASSEGVRKPETQITERWSDSVAEVEHRVLKFGEVEPVLGANMVAFSERTCETYYTASSEGVKKSETQVTERWSDPVAEAETAAPYEPTSEMYYTASSEVSLLSETDLIEKVQSEDPDKDKDDRNIIAGHVAAMRERFESMTRANTPCPDLVRSLSPSLDVFRNITPSPDFLDKS